MGLVPGWREGDVEASLQDGVGAPCAQGASSVGWARPGDGVANCRARCGVAKGSGLGSRRSGVGTAAGFALHRNKAGASHTSCSQSASAFFSD